MIGLVGQVNVSAPGERHDLTEPFVTEVRERLRDEGLKVHSVAGLALSAEDVARATDEVVAAGASALIYVIGTWIHPPAVVRPAHSVGMPSVLIANPAPGSFAFTGASILHGSFDRLRLPHCIHLGVPGDRAWTASAGPFLRAAGVAHALRASKLGLFGGQAPGQYTGSVDLLETQEIFGVEIEQIDELAVVERAKAIPDPEARRAADGLVGDLFERDIPEQVLLRSMKLSLSLEREVLERGLDFASVKCLGETINSYASFCVAATLLNSSRHSISCQGDVPATILMEAFRHLTGEPAFFADLIALDIEGRRGTLGNCGAGPISLAARPRDVQWRRQYEYMGDAGGVTSSFAMRSGTVTIAALSHTAEAFRLMVSRGDAHPEPRARFEEIRSAWPYAFVSFEERPDGIVQELRSNHVVMAYGDYVAELCSLADLWQIERIVV